MVSPASRMLRAISLGVFWRSAPSTRAIMRSMKLSPGLVVILHHDAVGQHPGAAGDRRAVAARLADDRGRLAGDGRLVDRGDALDDVAVAGDQLAGVARRTASPTCSCARRHLDGRAVGLADVGDGLRAGLAQRVGLGLAPALGHGLGEVGEQHGEPQPDGHQPAEHAGGGRWRCCRSRKNRTVVQHRADQHHEHHRVAGLGAGVELDEASTDRPGARWPARTATSPCARGGAGPCSGSGAGRRGCRELRGH